MALPNSLKKLRESQKRTLEDVAAAAGISPSYLSNLERGKRNLSMKKMDQLAFALGVRREDVVATDAEVPDLRPLTKFLTPAPTSKDPAGITLPLYGIKETDHGLEVTGEILDFLDKTTLLTSIRNAYGMHIIDATMEPAYSRGDLVIINPSTPAKPGDDVIIFESKLGAGTAAAIGRMAKISAKEYEIEQFNPKKTRHFLRSNWLICHRIVARFPR